MNKPDSMYGWQFDKSLDEIETVMRHHGYDPHANRFGNYAEYLIERCRRTESELNRLRAELKEAQTMLENAALEPEAKPMTVEELRAEFEKDFKPEHLTRVELEGDEWDYERNFVFERWLGFLACARLLGKMEEK